ncbi:MAG: histidine kinase dimerization/phospho-acceptor domain-containing protein, partial [Sulfurospirillum sp.]
MKFNSLKIRILSWFASLVTIILLIFSLFLYHSLNTSINLKIKHNLSNIAQTLQNKIKKEKNLSNTLKQTEFSPYDIAIYKNTKLIAKKGDVNFQRLSKQVEGREFLTIENGKFIDAVYTLNLPKSDEKIFVYRKNIDDKIEDIVTTMFFLEPTLLILLIFLGNTLMNKILFTIKSITKTAKNVSVDHFSSTIPLPKYDDETRELVIAFNDMVHRLKEETEKIERFNSDVSHELKTPLTVIKGEIEIASLKNRDVSYYQNILKTIDTEASQIQFIMENLLLLTRYTKDNIEQTYRFCYLDSLLLNIIGKFNTNLKAKDLHLQILKIENIQLKANEILINTIFSNLIDNAIKYTQNGKNIYISLFTKDKK